MPIENKGHALYPLNIQTTKLANALFLIGKYMTIKLKPKNPISLQGDLSVITVENLMQLVGHAALYGELQIKTPKNSAILFVHKGTLLYAHLEKNPIKIGQRLIQGNHITRAKLQECLSRYRNELSQARIGRVLVEKKYIEQKDLEQVFREQAKHVFFEILSWKRGSFAFFVKRISKSEDIFLQERIDHLTLEGIFHVDELSSPGDEDDLESTSNVKSVVGY